MWLPYQNSSSFNLFAIKRTKNKIRTLGILLKMHIGQMQRHILQGVLGSIMCDQSCTGKCELSNANTFSIYIL